MSGEDIFAKWLKYMSEEAGSDVADSASDEAALSVAEWVRSVAPEAQVEEITSESEERPRLIRRKSTWAQYKIINYHYTHGSDAERALIRLAHDNERYVRLGVAENPNCPAYLLERLAEDEEYHMQFAVADNRNCPAELRLAIYRRFLDEGFLGADEYAECFRMAWNSFTPPEILRRLAADEDRNIRGGVACNPNCPEDVLHKLCDDPDDGVADTATEVLWAKKDLTEEDISWIEELTQEWCLSSPLSSPTVRGFLRNPSCPEKTLLRWAGGASMQARHDAAAMLVPQEAKSGE